MIAGFIIWSIVSLTLAGFGIAALRSGKAAGFFTGTKPPEVSDVRKYNRVVAALWFVYAALFELLGLPFLFSKQNGAGFLWAVAGVPFISIGMMLAYYRILRRYERK